MAYMSQEGYDKLVADLQYLESVERPKASAAIAEQVMTGYVNYLGSGESINPNRSLKVKLSFCHINYLI